MSGAAPLLLALALAGCREGSEDSAAADPLLQTDEARYPAAGRMTAALPEGVHGTVKLVVEHRVIGTEDDDPEDRAYVAKGTGSLVVARGRWWIVTARHVVLHDLDTKLIKLEDEEVRFDTIEAIGTKVAIGSLGAPAARLHLSTKADVAFLEVPVDAQALVARSLEEHAGGPLPISGGAPEAGEAVEAWGFPAKVHPQVESVVVATVRPGFFIVNRALPPGFSGGPALVVRDGSRSLAGMVIRWDAEANQSTVLAWSDIAPLLDAVASGRGHEGLVSVQVPGEGNFGAVKVRAEVP